LERKTGARENINNPIKSNTRRTAKMLCLVLLISAGANTMASVIKAITATTPQLKIYEQNV
jgi:hypothetical protein